MQITPADTLVTLQVRDSLAQAADVAVLVAAAAVIVLAVFAVITMTGFNRGMRELRRAVHQNLGPASDRARSISENVLFITQALRTDVERLNASVKALSARLHQASDHMEDRIEEFNALMQVVQGEAEDILLDTAATVRGVRAGARSLGGRDRVPSGEGAGAGEADELPPARGDEAILPGDR